MRSRCLHQTCTSSSSACYYILDVLQAELCTGPGSHKAVSWSVSSSSLIARLQVSEACSIEQRAVSVRHRL